VSLRAPDGHGSNGLQTPPSLFAIKLDPSPRHRTSIRLRSNLSFGLHERSAPLPGNNHVTVSQYLHGTADGRIRNAVLLGQLTFARKLHGDLPVAYPALNVISNLHVRVFLGHGINRTRRHKINIDAL
jgi:hypothetical protein